jgi:hypothetical protein
MTLLMAGLRVLLNYAAANHALLESNKVRMNAVPQIFIFLSCKNA